MGEALVIPTEVRAWWGNQARVRRRVVAGTVFHEVGYRKRTGGFCLVARAPALSVAVEKARLRLCVHPAAVLAPAPAPKEKPRRKARPADPEVHHGMNTRDALDVARRRGWIVVDVNATGELRCQPPEGGRSVLVQHPTRRKDCPRALTAALLRRR